MQLPANNLCESVGMYRKEYSISIAYWWSVCLISTNEAIYHFLLHKFVASPISFMVSMEQESWNTVLFRYNYRFNEDVFELRRALRQFKSALVGTRCIATSATARFGKEPYDQRSSHGTRLGLHSDCARNLKRRNKTFLTKPTRPLPHS